MKTDTPLRIAISGAAGRMGRRLIALSHAAHDLQLVGALEADDSPALGLDAGELAGSGPLGLAVTADADEALGGAQVVLDFTCAAAVPAVAAAAAARGVALATGTTGLDEAAGEALQQAAARVPVLAAPNYSLGIAVLRALLERAAGWLGPDFDIEILELHHRGKRDTPSGTALELGRVAAAARDLKHEPTLQRAGRDAARRSGEIGIFGLRGGDVVGEHTVLLLGLGERLELTHRALDRDILVRGALRAARWLAGQQPGSYTLDDLLS